MSLGFTSMVARQAPERRRLHHLYTHHQMEFILRRERGRADRHQHQFSLVVFHVARDSTRASPLMRLARIILDHARATDEIGNYRHGTLAAILPNTGSVGVLRLAH